MRRFTQTLGSEFFGSAFVSPIVGLDLSILMGAGLLDLV